MLGNQALQKDRAPLRIKTGRHVIDHHLHHIGFDQGMLCIFRRQGMPIRNHEIGFIAFELLPIIKSAQEVSQVELGGGTHPA